MRQPVIRAPGAVRPHCATCRHYRTISVVSTDTCMRDGKCTVAANVCHAWEPVAPPRCQQSDLDRGQNAARARVSRDG